MATTTSKRGRDEPLSDALHKRRNEGDASRGASSASGSDYDDEVGHVHIRVGDYIANVYKYVCEGGKGTFGKVLMCEDRSSRADEPGRLVAIKVVRKIRKYSESARIEADLLADIARADPSGASGSVRAHRSFTWQEHVCIVFEPLGMSLFDYVKANEYRPLPLFCVQSFADQLTRAVAFLHAMGLVHTDLKLENVLLVSRAKLQPSTKETSARNGATSLVPQSTEIKLIDFGGATYVHESKKTSLINTRQYRSPEVILGMEWSTPSDIWSIGCMLMELYTGELLFPTVRCRAHGGRCDIGASPPTTPP
jgi:serine/threonine protein kinase